MKTYFEEPELKVIQFKLKEDILTDSNDDPPIEDDDQLPIVKP